MCLFFWRAIFVRASMSSRSRLSSDSFFFCSAVWANISSRSYNSSAFFAAAANLSCSFFRSAATRAASTASMCAAIAAASFSRARRRFTTRVI